MRDLIGITYDAVSGGPELTAAEWRQVETGLFVRDTNDLVIGGVRGGSVSNSGFSATIAPLTAVVQTLASRGVYQAVFPAGAAELAKTISAAHATLARVDAIDVKFYDHEADASTFRGADIVYTAGTAAGSPTAPAFSGVGHRLGTFAVPASGGGNPVWTANPSLIGYALAGGLLDVAGHPSNPRTGTAIYNRSTGVLEYWNGTVWVTMLGGAAAASASTTTDATTTSTTFVPGTAPVAVAFVAPPSGKVLVHLSGHLEQTTNTELSTASDVTRNGAVLGSGSSFRAGSGDRALICGDAVNSGAPSRIQATRTSLMTGLNPGDSYNTQFEFQTTAGGATNVLFREILIVPVL